MPANVVETSRDELNATCMRKPAGNGRLKVDVTVVHNGHNLTDPDSACQLPRLPPQPPYGGKAVGS